MTKFAFEDIGNRLRKLRLAKNIDTQSAFARMLGVDQQRYHNWESGFARVSIDTALKICTITGCTLDYIYRGDISSLPLNLVTLLSGPSDPPPSSSRKKG